MDTVADLHQAYAEWRRLTQAEGQAIRAGNWSFVAECQKAFLQLQQVIDKFTHAARSAANPPSASPSLPPKPSQRATVLELIELQRRNLAALQQRRQKLSKHIEDLTRTDRNLRGIQRSYAPPGPSGWSSYS